MKKWIWIVGIMVALAGCGAEDQPVFETVGPDAYVQDVKPMAGQISLSIPEEASQMAMAEDGGGSVYTWDGHSLQLLTMDGGNIHKTVETLTGMDYEGLTVMSYEKGALTYYQTVWSAAGEDGTMLGRALIADDGYYHYCVSLLSPEESDAQQVYDQLCASFSITDGTAEK